jgi:FkbM family methyltransferase
MLHLATSAAALARNKWLRAKRIVHEARGSDRYSRPALFDMERKLLAYLPETSGYFVEAGGNNGFDQSNTYFFERFRGWNGLLIEPIPALYRACRRLRTGSVVVNAALVADDYPSTTLTLLDAGLMSTVSGDGTAIPDIGAHVKHVLGERPATEIRVQARTLSRLLEEIGAPEIDFLSLDVEGYELPALRGLDITRHAPRFILVEALPVSGTGEHVAKLLDPHYEQCDLLSPHDYLYRRREPRK